MEERRSASTAPRLARTSPSHESRSESTGRSGRLGAVTSFLGLEEKEREWTLREMREMFQVMRAHFSTLYLIDRRTNKRIIPDLRGLIEALSVEATDSDIQQSFVCLRARILSESLSYLLIVELYDPHYKHEGFVSMLNARVGLLLSHGCPAAKPLRIVQNMSNSAVHSHVGMPAEMFHGPSFLGDRMLRMLAALSEAMYCCNALLHPTAAAPSEAVLQQTAHALAAAGALDGMERHVPQMRGLTPAMAGAFAAASQVAESMSVSMTRLPPAPKVSPSSRDAGAAAAASPIDDVATVTPPPSRLAVQSQSTLPTPPPVGSPPRYPKPGSYRSPEKARRPSPRAVNTSSPPPLPWMTPERYPTVAAAATAAAAAATSTAAAAHTTTVPTDTRPDLGDGPTHLRRAGGVPLEYVGGTTPPPVSAEEEAARIARRTERASRPSPGRDVLPAAPDLSALLSRATAGSAAAGPAAASDTAAPLTGASPGRVTTGSAGGSVAGSAGERPFGACFFCGQSGHAASRCHLRTACVHCGRDNHPSDMCRRRPGAESRGFGPRASPQRVRAAAQEHTVPDSWDAACGFALAVYRARVETAHPGQPSNEFPPRPLSSETLSDAHADAVRAAADAFAARAPDSGGDADREAAVSRLRKSIMLSADSGRSVHSGAYVVALTTQAEISARQCAALLERLMSREVMASAGALRRALATFEAQANGDARYAIAVKFLEASAAAAPAAATLLPEWRAKAQTFQTTTLATRLQRDFATLVSATDRLLSASQEASALSLSALNHDSLQQESDSDNDGDLPVPPASSGDITCSNCGQGNVLSARVCVSCAFPFSSHQQQ